MASYNENRSAILYNDESTIPDISDSSDSPSLPSLSLNCQLGANVGQISPKNFNMSNTTNNDSFAPLMTNGSHQMMTMREYDTKLNELKRENFNLKLRIYMLEKEKTGVSQPEYESAVAKELLKREKQIKAYQKIVEEKDAIFKENKLNYESKLKDKDVVIERMVNDKETLTNELTETSSVCRLLMAHLSEFVEFWKRYLPLDCNDPNDLITSLLNSSEDLLNSASVLITNDGNESVRNRSYFGIDLRNATQMSGTGMSSLGLLSDMSELITKSNARTSAEEKELPTVALVGKAIQTELTSVTLNNILSSFYDIINKHVVHKQTQTQISSFSTKNSQTQTVAKQLDDEWVQTDVVVSHDKSIATNTLTVHNSSSQCDGFVGHNKGTQHEMVNVKMNDSPNGRALDGYGMMDNNAFSTDEDRDHFIPVKTKPKSMSPNSKRCQNSDERQPNTLYTYKASLSPLKNTLRSKTKESDRTDGGFLPIETSAQIQNCLRTKNDDYLFKVPNDNLITKRSNQTDKPMMSNKALISSRLSSSSSSLEGANRVPDNGSLLPLDVNCLNKNNTNGDHLSSPDLGIGDSDFDLANIGQTGIGLRVYASVAHFKLLKEQINEAICSINTLDRLNQDLSLNMIDHHQFVSSFKPKISNISQLMNRSRNICRKFVIEDNDDLLKRLEKMRISKERMEKAITKQLHKTDILLKKAKINLKEN